MPNPFYQIYEGAALLAGAKPYFINCTAENDYLGDFDAVPAEVWEKQLCYLCVHLEIQQVQYSQKRNLKN